MKALCFTQFGDPEVLQWEDIPEPVVTAGSLLVRMKAIGLNYADMYRRRGNYHLVGSPPFILGYEGAGIVEAVGSGVIGFLPGDRVTFADVPHANAELTLVPQEHAVRLPDDIAFESAGALLLQGLTAHYLTHDSYRFSLTQRREVMLVHAAAGGVGQILIQIGKLLGAQVIGLTSSEAKRQTALAAGADQVYLYAEDWTEQVKHCTHDGAGVDVAYDSVGATLSQSFDAVRPTGTVVFYGMAGGDPAPVDPRYLMDTSKTLTGGDLWSYLTSHEQRQTRADQWFKWIQSGQIQLAEPTLFALSEGAQAHRYMESRQSTGKIILVP